MNNWIENKEILDKWIKIIRYHYTGDNSLKLAVLLERGISIILNDKLNLLNDFIEPAFIPVLIKKFIKNEDIDINIFIKELNNKLETINYEITDNNIDTIINGIIDNL